MFQKYKGFTLIELLVVIAIIGILSSVVLANLNGSRAKARDVARKADLKSLQLALELYFDVNKSYPATLDGLKPTFISAIPTDPSGRAYSYSGSGASYFLTATLENPAGSSYTVGPQ